MSELTQTLCFSIVAMPVVSSPSSDAPLTLGEPTETTHSRPAPRPGGRSARVQEAVHRAVRELTESPGRDALTVPLIAARAGVTPSTIYRRWGDLAELLADVSLQRMRPEGEPADTGTLHGDLLAWAEQYADEIASDVGRTMLRDVLSTTAGPGGGLACQCAGFVQAQVMQITERAARRGETAPPARRVMDAVVAPIIYRALFMPPAASAQEVRAWVASCLNDGHRAGELGSDQHG